MIYNKTIKHMRIEKYLTPDTSILSLETEQCIASSINDTLRDMDENNVYDENF